MTIDVRHYADPNHEDYLLLWQYRQSTNFLTLVTAFLEIIQAELIDPWDDFEAELSVSAAVEGWQDQMGARLGLIRPYGERDGRILTWASSSSAPPQHENTNRRYQWSKTESETDEAKATQFTGPTGAVGDLAPINDAPFREFLQSQVWRNRGGRSVTDIERMAGFIFGADNVWVEELPGGGSIKLHIITATDTFFTVLNNNEFLPKPAGISLDTQWHHPDTLGLFGMQTGSPGQIWKLNPDDMTAPRTGFYTGRDLPATLVQPIGAAGYQGSLYVANRGREGEADHLFLIDVWSPSSDTGRQFGDLGEITVSLPDGGVSHLIFPSGMTQLDSDLYLLDGDRGSRRLFRFTSLQRGNVRAVEVGQIPNIYNSVNQPPRSIAALNGDLFVGFAGGGMFPGGLMCRVDPHDVTRTTDGYGTLSVAATGSGVGILGMCADPGRDDALLVSTGGTNQGLWRINPNNFADTTSPYGQISTWAAAGVSTPIRSLVLL